MRLPGCRAPFLCRAECARTRAVLGAERRDDVWRRDDKSADAQSADIIKG